MIKDNSRIIIVFGMARSGTTVFTHVLGQHHKIHIFHNDQNFENDLVFSNKFEEMEDIVVNPMAQQASSIQAPVV